jgi:hypothetical protein
MSKGDRVGEVTTVHRPDRWESPEADPKQVRVVLATVAALLVIAGAPVVPTPPLPMVTAVSGTPGQPGPPFLERIEASQARLRLIPAGADDTAAGTAIAAGGRQFLHVDPDANRGRGSWVELLGDIDERTEVVGVLVPGSAAFLYHENFDRYHQRAADLVDHSHGRLALVVWADGTFPQGWVQGAMVRYPRALGAGLAQFSHDLRAEIEDRRGPDADVTVVVAGHSFGGAVVGAAERHGLVADVVLHLASAGMGEVRDPYDYPVPDRPRYAMTAPGDLISYVQGVPGPPGFGHGPDPERFRCVVVLPTGNLPDDPRLTDELGVPLGERAGAMIGGVSSHSDIFIRYSDAWWQIYRAFLGRVPVPHNCPPPDGAGHLHARVLPLVVPRVITDGRCRAGGGLRPDGRRVTTPAAG